MFFMVLKTGFLRLNDLDISSWDLGFIGQEHSKQLAYAWNTSDTMERWSWCFSLYQRETEGLSCVSSEMSRTPWSITYENSRGDANPWRRAQGHHELHDMSVDVSFFMFLRWARLEAATGSRTGLHVLWFSAEYVAAIAPYERHRQTQAELPSNDPTWNQETQAIPWPNEALRGAWAESVGSGPGRRSTSVSVPVLRSISDEGPRAAYETAGPANTHSLNTYKTQSMSRNTNGISVKTLKQPYKRFHKVEPVPGSTSFLILIQHSDQPIILGIGLQLMTSLGFQQVFGAFTPFLFIYHFPDFRDNLWIGLGTGLQLFFGEECCSRINKLIWTGAIDVQTNTITTMDCYIMYNYVIQENNWDCFEPNLTTIVPKDTL